MEIRFKTPMSIDCLAWNFPIQKAPFACPGKDLRGAVDSDGFRSFYGRYQEVIQSGQNISFEINNDDLRSIGFQRPRSAMRSAKIAAGLFHYLLANNYSTQRSAIFTLSLTAVAGMAYDFEKYGWEKGWDLVDPFWLPNSIHASISTHLARLGEQVKMAWSFIGGTDAVFSAIEQAYYCLDRQLVEEVVIICAEQINPFQREIYSEMSGNAFLMEGASALVFSKPGGFPAGKWGVRSLFSGSGPLPVVPDISVDLLEPFNFQNSLSIPVILARELAQREGEFTLATLDRDGRYWAIQLEHMT